MTVTVAAGRVLVEATAGTTPLIGTLVVLGLLLACIGIFFALNGSLRRMRNTFASMPHGSAPGTRPQPGAEPPPADEQAQTDPAEHPGPPSS